jgi:hypothetical protein
MPNIDIQPGVKLVASLPISFILYASNINIEIRNSRFEGKDIEVKMDNNTVETWIWFRSRQATSLAFLEWCFRFVLLLTFKILRTPIPESSSQHDSGLPEQSPNRQREILHRLVS